MKHVTQLVVISFERRKAVVTPFEVRMDASEGTHRNLIAAIWLTSFMIASPLLHTYEVEMAKRGSLIYSNDIHDIVVYMGKGGVVF